MIKVHSDQLHLLKGEEKQSFNSYACCEALDCEASFQSSEKIMVARNILTIATLAVFATAVLAQQASQKSK